VYRKVTVPVGRMSVPADDVPEGKLGMLDLVVKKAHEQKIVGRYYSTIA
jgi:hypothetical protein